MAHFDRDDIIITGLCDVESFDITTDGNRNWTQISVPETLLIPAQKPDIEQLNSVNISVRIVRQKVIETPASDGDNVEGKRLTGRKLIIEGELCQTISYTADVPEQSVHSAQFVVPFSAFIVIPAETALDANFQVNVCVEDVFIQDFTPRQIFKNVTLLLQAIQTPFIGCQDEQCL